MDADLKKALEKTANAIRQLSFEAVQKANSGHPGLPMGCAELGAYLYGVLLRHNPKNPHWINRDRLILSAGHGSMWLYSCLHLAGFDLSLDEIKRFRQLHSKTPGHPEYREAPGVESTTGPLGQGVGNAIGQALGMKIIADLFNKEGHEIINGKVFCLAGDGCLMEGVSSEASSLAGYLKLNNFILIHDANQVTLDGMLKQCSTEKVEERYRAYGFEIFEMDGNDLDSIDQVLGSIRNNQQRPIFITCRTVIGKGSPHKEGTFKVHGSPLGAEEVKATKETLGLPEEEFYIPQTVKSFFSSRIPKQEALEKEWNSRFQKWSEDHPELAKTFREMQRRTIPNDLGQALDKIEFPDPISGRKASQEVIQVLGDQLPFLYGGSADLSTSDCTMMKQFSLITPDDFSGRNIKFGIREFGMATVASGLYQTEMILPFIGTFFTFSDYMRNAVRLASLSKYHVIYQLTHDSVFLGEDGPTHQPVEHLAAMRAMPNLYVFRPADSEEVKGAWLAALHYEGPSLLVLSRQSLPALSVTKVPFQEGVYRGAYIVKKEKKKPDFTLFATGSELALALDVAQALEKQGKQVRVISMPCWELFEAQDFSYQKSVVDGDLGRRVSIEAGVSLGWNRWIGSEGISISIESFGLSAPLGDIAHEFGFTVEAVLERLLSGAR
ncbi:MAG: transketolase [Chlamydiota bacterium]